MTVDDTNPRPGEPEAQPLAACHEENARRVDRLESAAREAIAAMSAVADACEADDDGALQTAHYLRHRIDALRVALS